MSEQPAWYVLRVYPGKERQVKEKLEKRFHVPNAPQAVRIVAPAEALTGSDEAKKYAGFIFIQICLDPALWAIIHNTPGITGFVGTDPNPTPFPVSDWKQIPLVELAFSNQV